MTMLCEITIVIERCSRSQTMHSESVQLQVTPWHRRRTGA